MMIEGMAIAYLSLRAPDLGEFPEYSDNDRFHMELMLSPAEREQAATMAVELEAWFD
jgi:hypothetical protein